MGGDALVCVVRVLAQVLGDGCGVRRGASVVHRVDAGGGGGDGVGDGRVSAGGAAGLFGGGGEAGVARR